MTSDPARDEVRQEFLRAEKSLNAAEILLRGKCSVFFLQSANPTFLNGVNSQRAEFPPLKPCERCQIPAASGHIIQECSRGGLLLN